MCQSIHFFSKQTINLTNKLTQFMRVLFGSSQLCQFHPSFAFISHSLFATPLIFFPSTVVTVRFASLLIYSFNIPNIALSPDALRIGFFRAGHSCSANFPMR